MADRLNPGEALKEDESITSTNGGFTLVLQQDGNLVLYRNSDHGALWASGTEGNAASSAIMQADGNFVLYGFPRPLWASGTVGYPYSTLIMQDDGNLVIYQPVPRWASKTKQ